MSFVKISKTRDFLSSLNNNTLSRDLLPEFEERNTVTFITSSIYRIYACTLTFSMYHCVVHKS